MRGTAGGPLQARHGDPVAGHSSTRRPTVRSGDLAILYAVRWQAIYAVAEVAGAPEHDPSRDRWAWWFPLRPLLVLDDLTDAPPVQAAGVMTWSLGRHSYIRLAREQFEDAWEAIAAASRN